jgi:hypothetical protein
VLSWSLCVPGPALVLLLLRLLLVEVAWLLAYGQWKTVQVALGEASGIGTRSGALVLVPILTAVVMLLIAVRAGGAA